MQRDTEKIGTTSQENMEREKWRPSLAAVRAEIERLQRRRERRKEAWGIVSRVLFVAMAVVLINLYVVRIATVNGASMEPTLYNGDVLLCSPLGYTPDYGDIVVTEMDVGEGDLIKRVIALAGDTVDVDYQTGTVSVNGKQLSEPYTLEPTTLAGDMQFPATVPVGRVFLLGDNRNNSIDSRRSILGMVPKSTLLGKVYFRIYPFDRIGLL
ncbi:MAG: signal peptidase I [Christensenella sp.]|uniref:signal peptidase I n=1 Tax=Christensenella sp. TaxID=1935934 RepID=UPI002B1F0864|nr:signal peptidase I [Christensenella sp.]MEA5002563.1 signal peptidase I [Christensenella sp.]